MWLHQYNRNSIQESLIEDIFVSGIFVIQSKKDNNLYTISMWPKHIPIIFPKVDYFIIKKEKKKFFRTSNESGIVSYNNMLKNLSNFIEDYPNQVPNLKIITPSNSNKISKLFNNLEIENEVLDFGNIITFDNFVNVKP